MLQSYFADELARGVWQDHSDDLSLEQILETFEADLRSRGLIGTERPEANDFALLMARTYIRFPGTDRAA